MAGLEAWYRAFPLTVLCQETKAATIRQMWIRFPARVLMAPQSYLRIMVPTSPLPIGPFPSSDNPTQVTPDGSLLLTILNYSVTYTLNDCPPRATVCPALTGFSVSPGQTFTIPTNGTVTQTFPMVPLRVKEEYVAEGGHTGSSAFGFPFPSYTATYVFTGRTDFFSDEIRIQGSTEFTIGNFNNCAN